MKRIVLLVIFISMGVAFAQENNSSNESNSIQESKKATFTLESANKGTIEVKETKEGLIFKGSEDKVMVLTFIAYNGKPCMNLIKILNEMKKKHSDFDAFAVEMRKLEGASLKAYAKEKEIDFPIIGYKKAEPFVQYIAQRAGWRGSMPFILIFNKKGEVKYLQVGLIPIEGFEKAYQELK